MKKKTQQQPQQPHKNLQFEKKISNSILNFLNVIININRDRYSVGGIHQSDRQNELILFIFNELRIPSARFQTFLRTLREFSLDFESKKSFRSLEVIVIFFEFLPLRRFKIDTSFFYVH